jgi:hypothetical protein
MGRTSPAAVQAIIEVDSEIFLEPFIEAADALVTEICESKTKADGVTPYYDSPRLELIERWLAAHFYAIRDPRAATEQAGPVMQRIESEVDLGFDVTRYGQMAMRLDTAGGLAALNEQVKKGGTTIALHWLGTEYG